MKKSILRIQAQTIKATEFVDEVIKILVGDVDASVCEALEKCLRDIFDHPNEREVLENSLQKMKPYVKVQENQIIVKGKNTNLTENIDLAILTKNISEKISSIEE